MNRKIVNVEAYDGEPEEIIIELDNGNVIILSLKTKLCEPPFAEIIEKLYMPETDGERVHWHSGANLTLEEIIAMLRAENSCENKTSSN